MTQAAECWAGARWKDAHRLELLARNNHVETLVAPDQQMAVLVASMLLTYALLLIIFKRYRNDTVRMFRWETTTLQVAAKNPLAMTIHLVSMVLPLYLMGLI